MYVSRTVFGEVSIVSGSVEMTLSPDFIFSMATIPATAMTSVTATKHDGLTPAMVVCAKLYTELLCNVALKSLSVNRIQI